MNGGKGKNGESRPATKPKIDLPHIIISSSSSKHNKCKYCSAFFGGVILFLLFIVLIGTVFPYPFHASCLVRWKFGDQCTYVMQKFRCQILNWSYGNCGLRDSKCLYTLRTPRLNEDNVIRAMRISPDLRSLDKIRIAFEEVNGTCTAMAESVSSDRLRIFDYGSNYCNLHNLVTGVGFDRDPAFQELTSNIVCTQYHTAVCK